MLTSSSISKTVKLFFKKNQNINLVGIEITGRCTCKCFHCYASDLLNYPYMNFSQYKKIVEYLIKINIIKIYIVGGEPLTHPILLQMCKYSQEKGITNILVTNGFKFIDKGYCRNILPYLNQIEVSLRSSDENIHNRIISGLNINSKIIPNTNLAGGFKSTIKALKNISKYKTKDIKLIINLDLLETKYDLYSSPVNIVKLLIRNNIKIDGLYIQLVTNSGRAKLNPNKVKDMIISKNTLFKALEELLTVREKYNIRNVRCTDDPVKVGILKSNREIPLKYRNLLANESIPAFFSEGFKPNIIQDEIIYNSN